MLSLQSVWGEKSFFCWFDMSIFLNFDNWQCGNANCSVDMNAEIKSQICVIQKGLVCFYISWSVEKFWPLLATFDQKWEQICLLS